MRSDVLILGKGYLGRRLHEGIPSALSGRRITCLRDALTLLRRHRPKVLINAVGFIGEGNVDGCEKDPEKTLTANTFVPILLAEAALRCGVKLVHVSSGCIFHYDYTKDRPVTEHRVPDYFHLFYSRSKIYSERALTVLAEDFGVLIARLRIPLDDRRHPKNILDKLIRYRRVIDIPNSVTYIPDFIAALGHLIRIDARGVFNVVNKGGLRYQNLLDVYRRYEPGFTYELIPLADLNLKRTNLLLSPRKLEKTGFPVRRIDAVLDEAVRGYLGRS